MGTAAPPAGDVATFRFSTDDFSYAHGPQVRFVVDLDPKGPQKREYGRIVRSMEIAPSGPIPFGTLRENSGMGERLVQEGVLPAP